MKIARAGLPFIVPVALAAALSLALGAWVLGAGLAIVVGYFTYFFRDPDRHAPAGDNLVLAPGDGKLLAVSDQADGRIALAIFLGLLDVHVNRAPCDGVVESVDYRPGQFLAAWKPAAAEANEQNRVRFTTPAGVVEMWQVVGVAARRVQFWKAPGDRVRAGERVGIMKFGSRIDLFLPPGSRVDARPGERLRGGETILAHLPAGASS